jgi:hypothetical protein
MPFDFNEFLTLAVELSARADEAAKRSSISRAYYSAYHLALTRAEARVGTYQRRKDPTRIIRHQDKASHVWCWLQFMETNDAACNQIGVNGDRMKRRRHIADYVAADDPNLNAEVQRQIVEAQQFQTDMAALAANLPSPRP